MRASLAVLLVVFACNGARSGAPRRPTGEGEGPEVGMTPAALEDDLRATVLEAYRALAGGYEEAYLDGLAKDARLVLIDVEPSDVVVGYDPIACRLRQQYDDARLELASKALDVHLGADQRTGWVYDELSYRVAHEGRRVIIPLRVTGVYERQDGRWIKMMEHVSYGIPDEDLLASTGWPAGKDLRDDTPPTTASREVRDVLVALVEDKGDARIKHVAATGDALVVGSDPAREVRGAAVAELATVRSLYGYDYQTSVRDLRVRVSKSGKAAWGAANVELVGDGVRVPLRATWVLEKRDGSWQVVQTHVSAGVTRDELSLRVFGEAVTAAEREDRAQEKQIGWARQHGRPARY